MTHKKRHKENGGNIPPKNIFTIGNTSKRHFISPEVTPCTYSFLLCQRRIKSVNLSQAQSYLSRRFVFFRLAHGKKKFGKNMYFPATFHWESQVGAICRGRESWCWFCVFRPILQVFFSRTFLWIGNYGSVDWNITVREERGGVCNERVWGRIKDEITGAFSRASLFKMSSFCRVGRVRFGEDFWIKITRVGFITRRHM